MSEFSIISSKTRFLFLLGLLFTAALNLSAADSFYKDYSESERLVIAGAYLAVGEHYAQLGDSRKGDAYKSMADEIFPGIMYQDQPAQTVTQTQTAATSPARPGGKEPAAVQYYFGKMMRAVFSENIRDIDSLLAARLYLPGYDEGLSKSDVLAYVRSAFEKYPLDTIDPDVYYNLERLYIRPEGSAWVAEIDLTDEGIRVFRSEFGMTASRQKFYFREFREGWRLIAISGE